MVKYILELKVEGDSQVYQYNLDLALEQENCPESIFDANFKQIIKSKLESQIECKIGALPLDQMLEAWAGDIAQGYRVTQIILKFSFVMQEKLSRLPDQGFQDQPTIWSPPIDPIEPTVLPPLTLIPE